MVRQMPIYKGDDGWYFKDPYNLDEEFDHVGPYTTKDEANEGRHGLWDFYQNLSDMSLKARKQRQNDVSRVQTPDKPLQSDNRTGEDNPKRGALSSLRRGVQQLMFF